MSSNHLRDIPGHLERFVVEQRQDQYTPEDHAVWRFIMRQLIDFLSLHAHPAYIRGLKQTGISVERIPVIAEIDQHLQSFGWRAVPVSGFIPPAAFMEFQSLGILPIASDMRSIQHLQYTPAPDIVHEAAGHAPILIDAKFASYLRRYAEVARKAIPSHQDLTQYKAIRRLSDLKEHPDSTAEDIRAAEVELAKANASMGEPSEAAWLSRMNWWTAEYGLFGSLDKPQIFGAGLLSSVGESRLCLSPKVKKYRLSVNCIQVGYDITEPQPQLFVAESFDQLHDVLDELADLLAFRLGGMTGLTRARDAQTVVTVELDSGLQISGQLQHFLWDQKFDGPSFARWTGPVQLSCDSQELPGQGVKQHPTGFSSPLGRLVGLEHKALSLASAEDLRRLGLKVGQLTSLEFQSGPSLKGVLLEETRLNGRLLSLRFGDCTVRLGNEVLFAPEWGVFDLAVGETVRSVYAGPADAAHYGLHDPWTPARVPPRQLDPSRLPVLELFSRIRGLRSKIGVMEPASLASSYQDLAAAYLVDPSRSWLAGVELVELAHLLENPGLFEMAQAIRQRLQQWTANDAQTVECIADGLKLADVRF